MIDIYIQYGFNMPILGLRVLIDDNSQEISVHQITKANAEDTYPANLCTTKLDMLFVIDESASIGYDNWKAYVIPTIRKLLKNFDIGPNASRASLTTFSSSTKAIVKLGSAASSSPKKLDDALAKMMKSFAGGGTAPLLALKEVQAQIIANRRLDTKSVVIFTTDGIVEDEIRVLAVGDELKNIQKAELLCVGVGNANLKFLKKLCPKEPIHVENYEQFANQIVEYTKLICPPSIPPSTLEPTKQPTRRNTFSPSQSPTNNQEVAAAWWAFAFPILALIIASLVAYKYRNRILKRSAIQEKPNKIQEKQKTSLDHAPGADLSMLHYTGSFATMAVLPKKVEGKVLRETNDNISSNNQIKDKTANELEKAKKEGFDTMGFSIFNYVAQHTNEKTFTNNKPSNNIRQNTNKGPANTKDSNWLPSLQIPTMPEIIKHIKDKSCCCRRCNTKRGKSNATPFSSTQKQKETQSNLKTNNTTSSFKSNKNTTINTSTAQGSKGSSVMDKIKAIEKKNPKL